jgi:heavy metal sensor kinase
LSRLPIRLRLSLAFTAAASVLLVAAGWFLDLRLSENLSQALDQSLRQRSQDLAVFVHGGVRPLNLESTGLIERGESFAQVVDGNGSVIAASSSLKGRVLLSGQELARARKGSLFLDRPSVPGLDEPARLLADAVPSPNGPVVLVVGATQGNRLETLATLRKEMLIGGPVLLVAAALGGYALSGAALRPVDLMRRRAEAITAQEPGQRLPLPAAKDELARLGMTLNDMLARLEAALDRERKFVADASHELRTPLSLLRTELELALRQPRSGDELHTAIESAADDTRRLSQLAEDLLLMAAADQGELVVRPEVLSIDELLHSSAAGFGRQLAAQGRSIRIDGKSASCVVGDELRLERALANLIDNAVRHGAGDVEVFARRQGSSIELHVTDNGPGFAPEYLSRAFERFSRPDTARTGGGAGLGLAIVQAIARSHDGTAHAANRRGRGADLWLSLPLGESAASLCTTGPGVGHRQCGCQASSGLAIDATAAGSSPSTR